MKYLVEEDNCTIKLDSKREYVKAVEDYLKVTARMLSGVDEKGDWDEFSTLMIESLKILIEKEKYTEMYIEEDNGKYGAYTR